jgi:hypothetical protein
MDGTGIMTLLHEAVAVWIDATGHPERLEWRGERYTVSDTPTPLESLFDDHVTHLPHGVRNGWRFQATTDDGASRVFDVRDDRHDGRWTLMGTYE